MGIKSNYEAQIAYQLDILKLHGESVTALPTDSSKWFSYHALAMTEELGEVLKADKRWKTHRNTWYDKHNKAQEIADLYITVMNIAIFSGLSIEEFEAIINEKQKENIKKLEIFTKGEW